jgi:hypothetical protein
MDPPAEAGFAWSFLVLDEWREKVRFALWSFCMDVMNREFWQVVSADGARWWVDSASAAALAADRGCEVRLVSAVEAALGLAYWRLCVPAWVVRRGIRKAGGSQARALVCMCLRQLGMSEREIAEALELAASSVHELMDAYFEDREVVEALGVWGSARSETLFVEFIERADAGIEPGIGAGSAKPRAAGVVG